MLIRGGGVGSGGATPHLHLGGLFSLSSRREAMLLLSRRVASRAPAFAPQLARTLPASWVATASSRGFCSSLVEVPIPELGAESIVEGGILNIAKREGDYVAAEEMVAEIETGAHAIRPLAFEPWVRRPPAHPRVSSSLAQIR